MCLHECVCTRVGVSILAYAQSPEKGLRSLRAAVMGTCGIPACYTSVGDPVWPFSMTAQPGF